MSGLKIVKNTKSLGTLEIMPIAKPLAKKMIIENHYSGKWNNGGFGKYNFGIFREGNSECLGVAVYGYMKNQKARIFEHPNKKAWMIELNRMWIDDVLGKNSESILIAASLRLLRKLDRNIVAVQSFADGRLGCGTIYKAANFRYYGYHYTKFLENKKTGEIVHEQLLTDSTNTTGYLRHNLNYLIGDYKTFQVKTYRYVYPLCRHFSFTLKKEQPYPEYSKKVENIEWKRNNTLIAERMTQLIYRLV